MKELVNIIEDEFGVLFTKYELSVAGKKLVENVDTNTQLFVQQEERNQSKKRKKFLMHTKAKTHTKSGC